MTFSRESIGRISLPTALIIALSVAILCVLAQRSLPENFAEAAIVSPSISTAIDARKELLTHAVNISFVEDATTKSSVTIALADHPEWVNFISAQGGAIATVDAARVQAQLASDTSPLAAAADCAILSHWTDARGVMRAQTDCLASGGYTYDREAAAGTIVAALADDQSDVSIPLQRVPATITSDDGTRLTLLATGRSDFSNSPAGRVGNVKKALTERLNNVIVPAGGTFSFLSMLGDTDSGWYMALTIVNGGDLKSEPGGGICQVSTTLYRAALNAGLPIVQRANHSLYVSHYEKYGVGLDATIYTAKQDFKFQNNTGGPILIQASYQGDEAFVNVFGTDDGRRVVMDGPFFSKTSPADVMGSGTTLHVNEIGWKRTVTMPGQQPQTESILSRYGALPRTLAGEHPTESEVVKAGL